ncbi:MAG TPA: sugar ABC transporter substrate-binding protein [Trueperaceae bacterium]|nr:sugar ABC transporter substrate-binding protein [Trueperaceae bacterium]
MLKKFLALLVLVFVAGFASAQTVIEFATWGGTEDLAIYEELISEFEAEHPDIGVVLNHIPSAGDYEQNLATLIAAGAAPDVFFINNISLPGFAAQDAFMPLGEFADEAFLEDFFPGHLDAFRYNGELMAIPRDISNLVLFYNKDLFEAASVAWPTAGWTWDYFMAAAQELTQDTDGDGAIDQFGFGYSTFYLFWQPWIWSNGGMFFSDDHGEFTLNQGAALEGLEYYVGLRCDANVAPTSEQAAERSASSMFADGDAAMIVDGRWRVAPLNSNEAVDFAWDVALFPEGDAGSIVDADGSGWGISSTSNAPEAAWEFIQFVSSPEAMAKWTEAGIIIPARRSVGITDAFITPDVPPASDEVFIEANETAIPTETFEGWGEFVNLLNEGMSEVWLCATSVEDGLAMIAEDVDDLLSDYR